VCVHGRLTARCRRRDGHKPSSSQTNQECGQRPRVQGFRSYLICWIRSQRLQVRYCGRIKTPQPRVRATSAASARSSAGAPAAAEPRDGQQRRCRARHRAPRARCCSSRRSTACRSRLRAATRCTPLYKVSNKGLRLRAESDGEAQIRETAVECASARRSRPHHVLQQIESTRNPHRR
jgi:hypothetical protein